MADTSVSRLTVPIAWVAVALTVEAGIVMWLSNIESRVEYITRSGSPQAVSALSKLERHDAEIEDLKNRMDKVEEYERRAGLQ